MMNPSADPVTTPPIPVPLPGLRSTRRWLLPWALLAFCFFAPTREVMTVLLDPSNYASYAYFTAHGFQYGPEVIPMAGPYGFVLYGMVYNGELFWTRMACQFAVMGSFAALVLWFFHAARGSAWRWFWLLGLVFFTQSLEDLTYEWALLLAGLFMLQRTPRPPATALAGAAVLMALVSLVKGTHLMLAGATLAVVLTTLFMLRDCRRGLIVAATYTVAFLGFWALAGQHPAHIPAFLSGVLQLTNGYNEAMALQESTGAFLQGLATAALLAALIGWGAWHHRRDLTALGACALFAGYTFVKWKHGYVRADGHIFIFLQYAPVAASLVYLQSFVVNPDPTSPRVRRLGWGLIVAVLLVTQFLQPSQGLTRMGWLVDYASHQTGHRLRQVMQPMAVKERLDRELEGQIDIHDLALTRREVQDRTIDFFGVEHGVIPLNRLTYHPRPMSGGSFNAYNPYLQERNRAFLADPARRPDYFLVKLATVDYRLMTQDDGQALLELLHGYRPILAEQGYFLFQATPNPSRPEARFIERREVAFGETVEVPTVGPDEMLLARFEFPATFLGRLRALLYKAPLIFMDLQGEGIDEPAGRRIVPSMTSDPVLLGPVIEDNADLAYLYTDTPGKRLDRFTLSTSQPGAYARNLAVEFFSMPRPSQIENLDVAELAAFATFRVANVLPESISPPEARRISIDGLEVQSLHAPGEVVWQLQGDEREFVFTYGFEPRGYEEGDGNGVVFIVELRNEGQPPVRLFSRLLDPVRHADHRGNQTSRVLLPPVRAGARLALITDPGEYGDTAWDWSYVTKMLLKRGPFSLRQFPTFNRVPVAVDGEVASVLDTGSEQLFMLHPPGSLSFRLNGTESSLTFEFGIMEGAYTNNGQTDGVDYIVELVRTGQPAVEIVRRALRPLGVAADRGRQQVTIALPTHAPGDHLVIRTDPGPQGNTSWDWAYLINLNLQ